MKKSNSAKEEENQKEYQQKHIQQEQDHQDYQQKESLRKSKTRNRIFQIFYYFSLPMKIEI